MAVNENKWGLLYCPRNGWREGKRWLKIEKVLRQQHIDYDFVQSENQKSVERLVKMFINNGKEVPLLSSLLFRIFVILLYGPHCRIAYVFYSVPSP